MPLTLDHCQKEEVSETQDASKLNSFIHSPLDILCEEIVKKSTNAWGRVFLAHLYRESESKRKAKANLALAIAKRMPVAIREKVESMINYY